MRQYFKRRSRSLESSSSSNGTLPKEEPFDINLNIADVTVVSSYDEESKWVESSAISLPPDVHEERQRRQQQQQQQQQEHRQNSSERSRRNSSTRHSSSCSENTRRRSRTTTKDSILGLISRTDPLRHFNLLALSQAFFLIGSSLFIAASCFELHERSNNDRTSTFTGWEAQEPGETPTGYHLKLSTSVDTYVTKTMICMLGSSFCFLQVGFCNVVRSPLDKFHFFQILAGFFGLLSSMFWETKTILSDISYFFFVHAMTGQALLLLHYHLRKFVAPALADLKIENQENKKKRSTSNQIHRRYTFFSNKQQQGHFAYDSSQEELNQSPSGLMSDDGAASLDTEAIHPKEGNSQNSEGEYSFSIENSFSLDQESYPGGDSAGKIDLQPDRSDNSKSDATSVKKNREAKSDENEDERSEEAAVLLKFGSFLCIADSLFVLGSLIETALTYLTILVLPTQQDDENTWNNVARGLNLIPGIFWLLCAFVTVSTSIWMRRTVMLGARPVQLRRPQRPITNYIRGQGIPAQSENP